MCDRSGAVPGPHEWLQGQEAFDVPASKRGMAASAHLVSLATTETQLGPGLRLRNRPGWFALIIVRSSRRASLQRGTGQNRFPASPQCHRPGSCEGQAELFCLCPSPSFLFKYKLDALHLGTNAPLKTENLALWHIKIKTLNNLTTSRVRQQMLP